MLSLIIWWLNDLLEALLLCRSAQTRLYKQFPVFFGYILFVLCQSILRFYFYRWPYTVYKTVYWSSEFLTLFLGGFVVFEVYRLALQPYLGTAKMAKNVLFFLFALAIARAINVFLQDPYVLQEATGLEIERPLRIFQAIAIFSLLTVLLSYSIPLNRNLRGILLGYSLFIGERVLCLAFVGETGRGFWYYAYSASYVAALVTWLAYLWSPATEPQVANLQLEYDYNLIAAKTRQRLQEVRNYFRDLL